MELQRQIQFFKTADEKRLVATLITGAPKEFSFFVSGITVMLMILATLFYWMAPEEWADLLPAIPNNFFVQHEWWRVFTAVFIHADLAHLLSNMLMLWIFSFFIYGYFGFKVFPTITLMTAAVVNALALWTYDPQTTLLGASGLVYVLGGFWLAMYFLIQRQYRFWNRLIRVIGIALMLFAPSTFIPTTSYRTHAIGFIAGFFMAALYFYLNKEKIRSHDVYQELPSQFETPLA